MNTLKNLFNVLKTPGVGIAAVALVLLALAIPLAPKLYQWLKPRAAAVIKWFQARFGKGKPGSTPAPESNRPTDRLTKVWEQFLKQLPSAKTRRSILQFQPYVVMGPADSGTSELINTCVDWEKQKRQGAGVSLTDDPQLQVYLGSKALVLDLPAGEMLEDSNNSRTALQRLFKPLFSKRKPIVVVVLNPVTMIQLPDKKVSEQADLLRGKLDLLTEICGSPLELRVVLTHLESVRGYESFADLLHEHAASATLPLSPADLESEQRLQKLEDALRRGIKSFERLLPLALTRLDARENLALVDFVHKVPSYMPRVALFLETLCAPQAQGRHPKLERVYLTVQQEEGDGNPFHTPQEKTTPVPDVLRKHRVATVACTSLVLLFLGGCYLYERSLWKSALTALADYRLPSASATSGPQGAHGDSLSSHKRQLLQQITRFSSRHTDGPMRYLPSFFSSQDEQIAQRLSQELREQYILPELDRTLYSTQPHRRSLYLLGVLYSARDNTLGRRILDQMQHWQKATRLDSTLLEAYVHATTRAYHQRPPLERLRPVPEADATNNATPWLLYFRQLQEAIAAGSLSAEQLDGLRTGADHLLQALEVIQTYEQSKDILDALDVETDYEFGLSKTYAAASGALEAAALLHKSCPKVKLVLEQVRQEAHMAAQQESALLEELNRALDLSLDTPAQPDQLVLRCEMGGFTFEFKDEQWKALVRNSAAQQMVERFVLRPSEKHAVIFFSGKETPAPVVMNPLSDGSFLFTGKATLDGKYTRTAFERYVQTPLVNFTQIADKLQQAGKLREKERKTLERFIEGEVQKYARDYLAAIDGYYTSFGVGAGSATELKLLLGQLLGLGSPFTELLHVARDNTLLELDEQKVPLLTPMRQVRNRYASLHQVLAEQKPGVTQLDLYLALLQKMLEELEGRAKAAPEQGQPPAQEPVEAAAAPGFKELLSPAGQLSLSILRDEPGSYDKVVLAWLNSVDLDERLRGPFLAPVNALRLVGREEIQILLAQLWTERLRPELAPVLSAFPFDPQSERDATPEQLRALFHPQSGRFHQLVRQYIDPVSIRTDKGLSKLNRWGALKVPEELYPTLGNVRRLTETLWDAKGNPVPLRLQVASVPFDAAAAAQAQAAASPLNAKALLTLAYLSSGTSSLLNFNQRPSPTTLEVDWTRPREARLSIETLDQSSGAKSYPAAIVGNTSYWSLLHLLQQGERSGNVWTWQFQAAASQQNKGNPPRLPVRFQFQDDPWSLFAIEPRLPSEASATQPIP